MFLSLSFIVTNPVRLARIYKSRCLPCGARSLAVMASALEFPANHTGMAGTDAASCGIQCFRPWHTVFRALASDVSALALYAVGAVPQRVCGCFCRIAVRRECRGKSVPAVMQPCIATGTRASVVCNQQALKLMSRHLTEWVSAPTDMKSTPHSA